MWLFTDWLDFSGAELDPSDSKQVAAIAAVELEASRRDPYRHAEPHRWVFKTHQPGYVTAWDSGQLSC